MLLHRLASILPSMHVQLFYPDLDQYLDQDLDPDLDQDQDPDLDPHLDPHLAVIIIIFAPLAIYVSMEKNQQLLAD